MPQKSVRKARFQPIVQNYIEGAIRSDRKAQDLRNRVAEAKGSKVGLAMIPIIGSWVLFFYLELDMAWYPVLLGVLLVGGNLIYNRAWIVPFEKALEECRERDFYRWLDTMKKLNPMKIGVRYAGVGAYMPESPVVTDRPIMEHVRDDFRHFVYKSEEMHESVLPELLNVPIADLRYIPLGLSASDFIDDLTT